MWWAIQLSLHYVFIDKFVSEKKINSVNILVKLQAERLIVSYELCNVFLLKDGKLAS